jgi:hypothetical protein
MCPTDSSSSAHFPNMNPVPHRIPAAASATNARFFEDVLRDLLDGLLGLLQQSER